MTAKLPDLQTLITAGIDPITGLPIKATPPERLKQNLKTSLRILDEQNAINRYVWYNLPSSLDGQLLERVLYYKGQGMFFYMEDVDKFFFLPYALDGTIDVYGRFMGVTPVPFNGSTKSDKDKAWIQGLIRTPIYSMEDEVDEDMFLEGCVLLSDYSKQISQTVIPRQILQEGLIDLESEAIPFARTAIVANSGVKGMRVQNADDQAQVQLASRSIIHSALEGDPLVPIVGSVEFQELGQGAGAARVQEILLYMQSLDNQRLAFLGLKSGGIFQKKAQELQSEADLNASVAEMALQDGLTLRQKFCDLVNYIWGLGIWCDTSETSTGDHNGDGRIEDDQDQSGIAGEQPQMMEDVEQ